MSPNCLDRLAQIDLPPDLERVKRGIRLTDHRVSLFQILDVLHDGATLGQIKEMFPTVPAEQLAAVVTFCERHPDEMREYHEEQQAAFAALAGSRTGSAPTLAELRRRKAERVGPDKRND